MHLYRNINHLHSWGGGLGHLLGIIMWGPDMYGTIMFSCTAYPNMVLFCTPAWMLAWSITLTLAMNTELTVQVHTFVRMISVCM